MRRTDREINDSAAVDCLILACQTCRLGFNHPEGAYIVPLSFGFSHEDGVRVFHFHSAGVGRKMELMAENPRAGFEMDKGYTLVPGEQACDFSARFQSVIGTGTLKVVEDYSEKTRSLALIMQHETGRLDWVFPGAMLERTAVFRLTVTEISCKIHP
jgi:nitroimidazol reductase NimA-like FMN-containing flavoprotein (pyridoxamine 5'-phosphate oxidase superfamily)